MSKNIKSTVILLIVLFSVKTLAVDEYEKSMMELEKNVEELGDAPPLTQGIGNEMSNEPTVREDVIEARLVETRLRFDLMFSGGKPVEQGFSLPSLRFGALGELTSWLDYGFALATSREFSSMLIPQVLPSDAWIRLRDVSESSLKGEHSLAWKFGMFAPSLNPLWSEDLSVLPFPGYLAVHQSIFLSRDVGTEISIWPLPGSLGMNLGVCNGSGVANLNTNNTRAVNFLLEGKLPFGESKAGSGLGGYWLSQADKGGVNYISNWVVSWFLSWITDDRDVFFLADLSSGRFEDNSRGVSLFGASTSLSLTIQSGFLLFIRAEVLRYAPQSSAPINHAQFGPSFKLGKNAQSFIYYDYFQEELSSRPTHSGQVLIRVSL